MTTLPADCAERLAAEQTDWWLVRTGAGEAAWNMAFDEALLEFAGRHARPVLRWYEWREAAATMGYTQRWAAVAAATSLRPLIRRPTGGGVVPHDVDWTYSVVVPAGWPWYRLRARESYARLHGWVRDAFGRCGVAVELTPGLPAAVPGRCFLGAERDDVVWQGRKIAGAAQRRNRLGLLIQGSIQAPAGGPDRERFEAAFGAVATAAWGVRWIPLEPSEALRTRAEELVTIRYGRAGYNERR